MPKKEWKSPKLQIHGDVKKITKETFTHPQSS